MKNLYLASKNKGKIAEYKKLLAGVNCKLLLQPESLEVEEDGVTFRDNAIKKASEVSRKTNNFSIADDSGICIEALGGKPGIYSSRYDSFGASQYNLKRGSVPENLKRSQKFLLILNFIPSIFEIFFNL